MAAIQRRRAGSAGLAQLNQHLARQLLRRVVAVCSALRQVRVEGLGVEAGLGQRPTPVQDSEVTPVEVSHELIRDNVGALVATLVGWTSKLLAPALGTGSFQKWPFLDCGVCAHAGAETTVSEMPWVKDGQVVMKDGHQANLDQVFSGRNQNLLLLALARPLRATPSLAVEPLAPPTLDLAQTLM